jgi:hypothetical protein
MDAAYYEDLAGPLYGLLTGLEDPAEARGGAAAAPLHRHFGLALDSGRPADDLTGAAARHEALQCGPPETQQGYQRRRLGQRRRGVAVNADTASHSSATASVREVLAACTCLPPRACDPAARASPTREAAAWNSGDISAKVTRAEYATVVEFDASG